MADFDHNISDASPFPIRMPSPELAGDRPLPWPPSGIFRAQPDRCAILGAREVGSGGTAIKNSIEREGEVPRVEVKDSIDVLTCRLEAPAS